MDKHTPEAEPDITSDPARNDEKGHDWSTEGGATTEGPATSTEPVETEPERGDLE